ncbi:MAG: DUF3367 domain-containing protein [Ilumatobacter sp.]|nr:DUF3367 domain-containing protein [Ilumatobacter sp.]
MIDRWSTRAGLALLALLAYVPALASSPGRMPADTKLYLYLEPGALIGRAPSTFEPDQFAGWVPHQQITYLWPSGPWFWLLDAVGTPDWVAHRLWIGTLLFAAGTGAWWLARQLHLAPVAALVAGVVYQTSPYLLAYISRTSLLLLPWAGLGWIVALTVRATRVEPDSPRRRKWVEPAAIALIVATVGSVNATALVLVAPAPVLWLVVVAAREPGRLRELAAFAARTATLCVATSLWWLAMLVVQSRHGAPVLAYSETLADVSRSSTGSEVVRGLGYWLFYVRDAFAPTTTASTPYLTSGRGIAVSYLVTLVGLSGLAFTRWRERTFAAWLALVGVVIAVGVHPIGSSSPLMSLLVGDDESGLALALRSSTRAVPMLVLAVALGAGALVATVSVSRPSWGVIGAGAVATLAVVNLPALWQAELVDPAIDRDADVPDAWTAAAAALDRRDDGFRVLQLPGAEFGAFEWGYTVDQPLVALTDRPLVTRDLLPLGSGPAMDLLYAFDNRVQEGTLETGAIAPVSRLFGADVIWVANDLESLRFRTPASAVVDAVLTAAGVDGLGAVERFGDAAGAAAAGAVVDAASLHVGSGSAPSAVALVAVEEPEPIVRAKADTVLLSGSGDGIVDAAAAGLLSGHELVRYSASLDHAELTEAVASADAVVVTDSNRDRAHHWRGSQDVLGHTEPGGPAPDVLVTTAADRRLDVFGDVDADRQTVAVQHGPVSAVASGYGEPFAYRPEDRAVMAIDGDSATAWRVGDHGDPVGESIRLVADEPTPAIVLHQAVPPPGGRQIERISIVVGDGPPVLAVLDDSSVDGRGQRFDVGAAADAPIEIRIESVTVGDLTRRVARAGVGFSEIDLGHGPTIELIRPPVDLLGALDDAVDVPADVSVVLSRLRVAATDPWRADPEPELQRIVPLTAPLDAELIATVRLDARASDALLSDVLDLAPTAIADRHLAGSLAHRGDAAVDGDGTTAWVTPFDDVLGSSLLVPLSGPVADLVIVQPVGRYSPITELAVAHGGGELTVPVPPPDGTGRSVVALPTAVDGSTMRLTVVGIDPRTAIERRYGDPIVLPAGIAELSATDGIDVRSLDPSTVVERDCTPSMLVVDGVPQPLSFRTTVGELLAGEPVEARRCGGPLALSPGTHELRSVARGITGFTVDRVVLQTAVDGAAEPSQVAVDVLVDDPLHRAASVSCPDGCWFVLGEGFNTAWTARTDSSLDPPQLVDGGFNGWWIEPTGAPVRVDVRWSAQRPVTVALALSMLAVAGCLALLAAARRTGRVAVAPVTARPSDDERPVPVISAVVLAGAAAVLIGPIWALAAVAAVSIEAAVHSVTSGRLRSVVRLESLGVVAVAAIAVAVIAIERREQPFADAGWTLLVDHLNGIAVFAVLLLAVGTSRRGLGRVSGWVSARTGTDTRTAADAA